MLHGDVPVRRRREAIELYGLAHGQLDAACAVYRPVHASHTLSSIAVWLPSSRP